MSREEIKDLVDSWILEDGMIETGIDGVQLFRVSEAQRCSPAVMEPAIIVILNGSKEAILNGKSYIYDSSQYMCCPMSIPVEAGTPETTPDNPLYGVYISLNTKVITELTIQMNSSIGAISKQRSSHIPQTLTLADWDKSFTDALLRLLQLRESPADMKILGEGRLRELYYSVLKGDAGEAVRNSFGVGNEIAKAIEYFSSHLDEPVTIEDMASQVGMSRAVFHRKFKQATTLSPIQFVKSMKLNSAAMMIAGGKTVNEAAMGVGYVSPSQFSREFKRLYGESPKQWSNSKHIREHSTNFLERLESTRH